jgi:hypothetical protein
MPTPPAPSLSRRISRHNGIVRLLGIALLVVVQTPALHGQASDSLREPSTTPQPTAPVRRWDPADSALSRPGGWPRWIGAPLVFMTPRYVVLATTPISARWITTHESGAALGVDCRDILPDGGLASVARPWAAFDSTLGDAPLIMLQIMPALRRGRPSCQGNRPPAPALALRGVALQERAGGDEYQYPRHARVTVDDRIVEPVIYGRVPVEVLPTKASRGAAADDLSQLRLYLDPYEIAPDSAGRMPRVTVRVWSDDSTSAVDFAVPSDIVHQLWFDLLPYRLESYAAVSGEIQRAPLPAPSDSALRLAWQSYAEGDPQQAALLTAARYHAAPLTRDDSLQSGVQLALSLLALHDTLDATPFIRAVVHDNPCLTLAASAPADYATRFDRLRPRSRCDVAVGRTIVKSIVFPGLGQITTGRPHGWIFTAGSSVAFTFAIKKYLSSQSSYDAYQSNSNSAVAVVLYRRASRQRRNARNAALVGAGIWLLGAVEAGISEMHHGSEVGRVRDYGLQPTIRSEGGRADFGLSLTF